MLGNDLLSRRVAPTVPSALEGLTSVFGKGTGVSPPPLSPNPGIIPGPEVLPRAAAAGAKTLDLAGLRRRDVVRTASHLAHESLFLHLAAELAQRLLELFGVLDDNSHDPTRIQASQRGPLA